MSKKLEEIQGGRMVKSICPPGLDSKGEGAEEGGMARNEEQGSRRGEDGGRRGVGGARFGQARDWPGGLPGDSRWAGGLVGRWASITGEPVTSKTTFMI